jgi:phenylalanyl-tRNA synthetase beta subunit
VVASDQPALGSKRIMVGFDDVFAIIKPFLKKNVELVKLFDLY